MSDWLGGEECGCGQVGHSVLVSTYSVGGPGHLERTRPSCPHKACGWAGWRPQGIADRVYFLSSSFFFFCFLGPNPRHTEVPRLGLESELQLSAYTTAVVTQDPSSICDLHSSQRCRIPNPLSEARDQTRNLVDTSQIRFHFATMGTLGVFYCNPEFSD